MKTTLIIIAAGEASRYGKLKQTENIGPSNVTLMEYSIYDAFQAGFSDFIIVIKKEHISSFYTIRKRIKKTINISFVYQNTEQFTDNININYRRIKPWGTGHALLVCKEICTTPFAIINADDYYGSINFKYAIKFLKKEKESYLTIPYFLHNTLSENGKVNRGICKIKNNLLIKIYEKKNLTKENSKNKNHLVSMNFWVFQPTIFPYIEDLFHIFLQNHKEPSDEFYLSSVIQHLVKNDIKKVYIIPAKEKWYGITYEKDKKSTHNALCKLNYPLNLWN